MSEALSVLHRKETLAQIQDRFETLCELVEDPSLSVDERNDSLQQLKQLIAVELPRKVDNVVGFLRFCQDQQRVCAAAVQFAEEKQAMWRKREGDLRNLVKIIMQVSNTPLYRGALSLICLRPPAKSVQVFSEALLPLQYFVIDPPKLKVNKTAIRHALDNGVEVPGARLVPGDDVLEVR